MQEVNELAFVVLGGRGLKQPESAAKGEELPQRRLHCTFLERLCSQRDHRQKAQLCVANS